jgi:hypothetical protein
MNWFILAAGIVALLTTIGHFAVGSKEFLKPMLDASFDQVPKKVMHCVFHYASVFLVMSSVCLILAGAGVDMGGDATLMVRFISVCYALFAVWQIVIAATSGIPKGVLKLFQWMFFVVIATCAWLGTVCWA